MQSTKEKKIQQYKIDAVTKLKKEIGTTRDILIADFRGLNVEQISNLRRQLREKKSTLLVVKNNLAKIAFKELGVTVDENQLTGPTALTLIKSDIGPVAKMMMDFSKESPLKLKGGIISGKIFPVESLEAVANLPSKEQMIGILMGTMNAPLKNLMYAMNGIASKLARTLQAVADKKEEK